MEFGREDLDKIICETFNIEKVTSLMNKQIVKFITELGYTYKEIAQALIFFADVEKGNIDIKYGLGIVPHVMDKAQSYIRKLEIQRDQQIRSIQKAKKSEKINIIFNNKIKRKQNKKAIDLEKINID